MLVCNFPQIEGGKSYGNFIYSRKAKCNERELRRTGLTVTRFNGNQAEILPIHFCIDPQVLQVIASDVEIEGKHIDLNMLHAQFGCASTFANTPPLTQQVQRILPVDSIIAGLSTLCIDNGNSAICVVCSVNVAATVLTPVGLIAPTPGSIKPTHCWQCANAMDLPPGSWVVNLASCGCGVTKYGTFKDCERCRRHMPCRIAGCELGGNGNTDPVRQLCKNHYNELQRVKLDSKRDEELKKCKRCDSVIESGLRMFATCSECTGKCCHQYPGGNFCEKKSSGKGTKQPNLCPDHGKERLLELSRIENKKRRGELPREQQVWSDEETNELIVLYDDKKNRRENGDRNWPMILKKFKTTFPKSNKTSAQLQRKMVRVNKKRAKKNEVDKKSNRQVTTASKGCLQRSVRGRPKKKKAPCEVDGCGTPSEFGKRLCKVIGCRQKCTGIDNLCNYHRRRA